MRSFIKNKLIAHFVEHFFLIFLFSFLFKTGELIGVEYLYAQTGQVLQNTSDEQEELPPQTSDVEDADEGFQVSNKFASYSLP